MNTRNIFQVIAGLVVGYLLSPLSPLTHPFLANIRLQDGAPDRWYIILALDVLIPALVGYIFKESSPLFAKTVAIVTLLITVLSQYALMALGCLFSCKDGEMLLVFLLPLRAIATVLIVLWPFIYTKLKRWHFFLAFTIVIIITIVLLFMESASF